MKKENPEDVWKIEKLSDIRSYRLEKKFLKFIGIVYHTLLPVLFTAFTLKYNNPFYFIPVLLILVIRLKVD